jgi:hypothetical protein
LIDLFPCQLSLPTKTDAPLFGFLNTICLTFGTDLRFKLRDSPQHVEQQASRCIGRIDILVQYLKVDLFPLEFISDLAQMQGGAGQSVQACDNECVAPPLTYSERQAFSRGRRPEAPLFFSWKIFSQCFSLSRCTARL